MYILLEHIVKIIAVGFISLIVLGNLLNRPLVSTYESDGMSATTTLQVKTSTISVATSTTNLNISTSSTSTNDRVLSPHIKTSTTTANTKKQSPTETLLKPIVQEVTEKLQISIKAPNETEKKPGNSNDVNVLTRNAIVNILCYTENAGSLKPITGSGIIIDERGVILTNAHLAQYYLLRDYPTKNNVDCLIRTGSPAIATYKGELLFISPSWIEENHKNITESNPLGTGENDFGLILITSMVDKNAVLPATFSNVSINTNEMYEKETLSDTYVVVGYPAGFLGGLTIIQNLFISSTVSSVKQVYTFKNNTVDLLSLGGSVLAQKGSSGGAVVRVSDSKLVAIIVTTSEESNTSQRDLRAVTTSHINKSFEASTNQDLYSYLSGNLVEKLIQFHQTHFLYLKGLLVDQLTSR